MQSRDHVRKAPRPRTALTQLQLVKLNRGLLLLRRRNRFYRKKLEGAPLPLEDLSELVSLPFTHKHELVRDQEEYPPFGSNLTSPRWKYTRIHSTSGTTGRPLVWLDTARSWAWWLHCWKEVLRAAGVGRDDVLFAAFGFGPFIGFWGAFEAAQALGAMVVAGGAQSSLQRIEWLRASGATVLLSTPTYALRLADVARENGIDLSGGSVRVSIHAGEPGANIPATRARIEQAWGARCFDHAGMTEVGAWGLDCSKRSGMHLLETDFIGEVVDPHTNAPVPAGKEGELVLTNLGRWDMPAVRYRTGDIVRLRKGPCGCGSPYLCFAGGVVGRADDMVTVRGINVYPSAVEALVRTQGAVVEFEVEVFRRGEMWELEVRVEVEPPSKATEVCQSLSRQFQTGLGLRTSVRALPARSLPRYDLKARRFKIRRD
ncbi:MAG: phenylacetate--CoA ligase family protein [Acidobacteriota bacterium]